MKKFWNWLNQADADPSAERVLELTGTIAEESWFDDDVTPAMFKAELFSGNGPVTIWINSPGGDCIAASQIYSMLMDYKGDVTVKIDGIAASAASVIAMAGTKVLMSPVSMLMLTTKATKEIAGRYGGLENLGEKLMKSENFEMAIGEIVWLITLLANQSLLIHNLKHKDQPKELLTEEMVELLTVPADLATYKAAITEALYKGTKRNIESEADAKNAVVG